MNQQLAFLGLGVMGGPMSANLARAGYPIKGWNRTPDRPEITTALEAGVEIVSSIQEAVATADVIFSCVGDVPDVEEVLCGPGGVAEWARPETLVVDMSTIGPNAAQAIAQTLSTKSLRFLDAPVSGGDIGAQNGTLTIMVGGSEADFNECLPFFEVMGKSIHLCGPVGSGQAVKLCNQVLCSANLIGLCEAIKLAQKQKIDPNLIVEVCRGGAAGSWALSNLGPKINQSDFAPGFAIKHILKDLRLVLEMIEAEDFPGTELANQHFKSVEKLDNGGELGTQAMMKIYHPS
ncbi:MAG: NAD(P)-dependent oxidoreductase [Roseofilum sp. SBFL]|uniref:NAD(P)-dependent oxidoreductase n=1 Tax=unclassified Roseofilum TaxID=2620099 RepID=UPI001B213814|nr:MULTISPECIES: NAD(P)-dependent oxidoreductase [unclassified Roseofilum]MBP0012156.1 NAD(P)-dependent oxidoreductase [Roseofilum sp. SID3]MBP0022379.1 NAD(P)-dependent oxidoreductase [Roseofilum sp. SID2]MBP0039919.1 NAD(P)-dependent oxidoreductase [Roseofilum sp. SID1]MBP0041749.1 NAD(P)-dependent oxidoreductase [Roseofilum sp. SBFL]